MRTLILSLALIAATACTDGDKSSDTESDPGLIDADDDGSPADEDCDDEDDTIYPGADEICDGIDQDCDDSTDEGVEITVYADADDDGYGDAESAAAACEVSDGYSEDSTDCDDDDAAVNPAATEICNAIDDDCDDAIDDADDSLDSSTASTFYADADTDGYGDASVSAAACEAPSGYVDDATDCDDADAAVNTEATEICDSIDNDCDEAIDDADDSLDTSTGSSFYADGDSDGYGDATSATVACEAPSGTVSDASDCDDANDAINPAATEICDGEDNDCNGDIDDDDTGLDTSTADTTFADRDGDGYGDPDNSELSCETPSNFVSDNTDCDDSNADISPAATEICDDEDNDCDGDIDDADTGLDLTTADTWYLDDDGDGFGDADSSSVSCEALSGYVSDGTDCDDSDSAVNTSATEVCNDVDDDCDGLSDDADTGLDTSTASTWYDDADGDGFGDADVSSLTCEAPSGYVDDASDCNDSSSSINPDASEVCNEADDDCDGFTDDEDTGVDLSTGTTFYVDGDGDGYGDADSSLQSCSLPSGYATSDEDCDDGDADVSPGATEVPQDGTDQDCDGTDAPYGVTDLVEGDLIVTEVMQNPNAVSDSKGEWFEVYNLAGGEVDLDGLYVYDLGSNDFTVSGELLVEDGEYVVFGNEDDTGLNGGVPVDYAFSSSSMALANGDDEIYLAESSAMAVVFDGIEWDNGATFPDPTGYSMSLDPGYYDEADNDDGLNWCEASSSYGDGDYGTPGDDNDACEVETTLIGAQTAGSGYETAAADVLLGHQITVSSDVTLDAFGAFFNSATGNFQMALYEDSSGSPGSLVAYTSSTATAAGEVNIDITDVALSAGDYWVMGIYSTTSYPNSSGTDTMAFKALTFGSAIPDPYGSATTYTGGQISYYIEVY